MDYLQQFRVDGRKALVTGANRGIGREIAVALGQAGADVAVHYLGNRDCAIELCEQLPGRSCMIEADLSEEGAAQRIADEAEAQLGQIDILVLNAAVQYVRNWDDFNREEFDKQVAINFRSVFEFVARLGPKMAEHGWGRILIVGSVQHKRPAFNMQVYGALKSAAEHYVRNLSTQLGPAGVTVNYISPGIINTDRNAASLADEEKAARWAKGTPMGRIGEPGDCACAALLLCSEAGSFITGADLPIDGGIGAR